MALVVPISDRWQSTVALLQHIKVYSSAPWTESLAESWWIVALHIRARIRLIVEASRRQGIALLPAVESPESSPFSLGETERSTSALRGETHLCYIGAHLRERASYGPSAHRSCERCVWRLALGRRAWSPESSLKSPPSHPRNRAKWGRSATTFPSTRWRPWALCFWWVHSARLLRSIRFPSARDDLTLIRLNSRIGPGLSKRPFVLRPANQTRPRLVTRIAQRELGRSYLKSSCFCPSRPFSAIITDALSAGRLRFDTINFMECEVKLTSLRGARYWTHTRRTYSSRGRLK